MSKAHLARQLVAEITEAACQGYGRQWSRWEAAHAAADTPAAAAAAAASAVAFCAGCPETERCAARAKIDDYSGLAAGTAWVNGARRPVTAVVLRPQPPERKAG